MRKGREVSLFVQTVEVYFVPDSEAGTDEDAIDVAKKRFHNGEDADLPGYGEARILDTDVQVFNGD